MALDASAAQLEQLVLNNTLVTKAGVERLKTAVPKCNVMWDAPK